MYECPYCRRTSDNEQEVIECERSHLPVVSVQPHYAQGQVVPTAIYVKMGDGSVAIFEPAEIYPNKTFA